MAEKKKNKSNSISNKKIKKHNKLLADSLLIGFMILFSLTYFYLDASVTGTAVLNGSYFGIKIIQEFNGTELNNSGEVYFNTTFNHTSGFVQLNDSADFGFGSTGRNFSFRGNYTSKIINLNATASVDNISWGEEVPYREELVGGFAPGSNFFETTSATRGFNMTGLILLMHFNNITNFENATNGSNFTVYDWSLNGFNGTGATSSYNGGPQFNETGGKFGGAFEFDGKAKNDYITLGTSSVLNLNSPSTFTITLWIKRASSTTGQEFIV